MKKQSKRILHSYDNDNCCSLQYYGILMKGDRARIDTKRYKKFFKLPDNKIERRKSVYYLPTKQHRFEYNCNRFTDSILILKELWVDEFSKAIDIIKKPKQVEEDTRVGYMCDGILSVDEAEIIARIKGEKRKNEYRMIIKSIYAQFFHQMMSQIDALSLKIIVENGYQEKYFSRDKFDVFIQGKQRMDIKSFRDFEYYYIYDRAYKVWNFIKHNSINAYNSLISNYPDMIYDPNNSYQNGDNALTVLKLDEKFIILTLNEIPKFFNEICIRAFNENPDDAKWDYDDYFINEVKETIDVIENPLDIPNYF